MAADPTPQLDYARAGPRRRVRLRPRQALALALLVIVVGLALWLGPAIYFHGSQLRHQRRATGYTAAPGAVIDQEQVRLLPISGESPYQSFAGRSNFTSPWPWAQYASENNLPVGAVAYLHEMPGKAGDRRVVLVGVHSQYWPPRSLRPLGVPRGEAGGLTVSLVACVVRPGTLMANPRVIGLVDPAATFSVPTDEDKPFQLFAGQPDPADPSHFTIDYQSGPDRGTIDGRLGPDDVLNLSVRDGPAVPGR